MFDPSKREQNFDDSKLDACVSTRDGSHVNSAWQALCKGCGPGKKKCVAPSKSSKTIWGKLEAISWKH